MNHMESEKISVIIPVYNVEKYLRECIDSVCNQTYRNLEIILVDDGSTDSSGAICDEYATKDARICVIHQENGGLSAARNCGIEVATGEYVYLLDSDDYIDCTAIARMYGCAQNTNADLVYTDAVAFYEEPYVGMCQQGYQRTRDFGAMSGKMTFTILMMEHAFHSACQLFFMRRHFLNEKGLRFERGVIFEDVLFSYQVFQNATCAVHCYFPCYYRRYRSGSIMTSRKSAHSFDNCLKIYGLLVKSAQQFSDISEPATQKYIARIAHNVLNYYYDMTAQERRTRKLPRDKFAQSIQAHSYFGDTSLKMKNISNVVWVGYKALEKFTKYLGMH